MYINLCGVVFALWEDRTSKLNSPTFVLEIIDIQAKEKYNNKAALIIYPQVWIR